MNIPNLLGSIAVLTLALGASGQTNSRIPTDRPTPGAETPQSVPPPGTQDDRQIPEGGRNRADQPANREQTTRATANTAPASSQSVFAEKAAKGALGEMQLGQLAQQKGSTSEVRDYGKMMVDDHGAAFRTINSMAESRNLKIGTGLDSTHQAAYERLSQLSGSAFDQAFATQMVNDHQEAIAEYERQSTSGDSDAWKTFAKDSLPTLNKHLEAAKKLSGASTPTGTNQSDVIRETRRSDPTRGNNPSYGTPSPTSADPRR